MYTQIQIKGKYQTSEADLTASLAVAKRPET